MYTCMYMYTVYMYLFCLYHCTCVAQLLQCFLTVNVTVLLVQVEMPVFECGDVVRMVSDIAEAYRLQQGHGDWNDEMAMVCTVLQM